MGLTRGSRAGRIGRAGARYLIVAAVCGAAATACGSQPAGSAAPGGSHAARVSLTITVDDHAGAPRHWTLRCDPPGGTHPDAAAACRVLLHAKNPFGAIPKGMMCPMIAADAKTATVKGTFFGRHIDTTFTEGGCQLLRWAKIGQIFS